MEKMKKTGECEKCRNLHKICDCPEKVKEVEAAALSDQQEKVVEVASDSTKEELIEKPKSKRVLKMASGRTLSVKMS
jgi:hypothetical protein